jgi:hypothetical protein
MRFVVLFVILFYLFSATAMYTPNTFRKKAVGVRIQLQNIPQHPITISDETYEKSLIPKPTKILQNAAKELEDTSIEIIIPKDTLEFWSNQSVYVKNLILDLNSSENLSLFIPKQILVFRDKDNKNIKEYTINLLNSLKTLYENQKSFQFSNLTLTTLIDLASINSFLEMQESTSHNSSHMLLLQNIARHLPQEGINTLKQLTSINNADLAQEILTEWIKNAKIDVNFLEHYQKELPSRNITNLFESEFYLHAHNVSNPYIPFFNKKIIIYSLITYDNNDQNTRIKFIVKNMDNPTKTTTIFDKVYPGMTDFQYISNLEGSFLLLRINYNNFTIINTSTKETHKLVLNDPLVIRLDKNFLCSINKEKKYYKKETSDK